MYHNKSDRHQPVNKDGKKLLNSKRPKSFSERSTERHDERIRHKQSMNKAKEKAARGASEKERMYNRKMLTVDQAVHSLSAMGQGVNVSNAVTQNGNSNQILSQTGLTPSNGDNSNGGNNIG